MRLPSPFCPNFLGWVFPIDPFWIRRGAGCDWLDNGLPEAEPLSAKLVLQYLGASKAGGAFCLCYCGRRTSNP